MIINAILAHDEKYGIGKNNSLPWPHNSADMKWFRECTIGGVVVMGRKTWESIGSKLLPNRINIVVSKQKFPSPKDGGPHHVLSSETGKLGQDFKLLLEHLYPDLKVWIIGGAAIYLQTLYACDYIYVTKFPGDWQCDTFISLKEHLSECVEIAKKEQDGLTFSIWQRI